MEKQRKEIVKFLKANDINKLIILSDKYIESFPDDYFFEGTISQCYSQIGNAVPPLLSKYLCMAIEQIND